MTETLDLPPTSGFGRFLVLKFGGTSVSSKDRWQSIRDILQARVDGGDKIVVVVSALAGVSDELEKLPGKAEQGNKYSDVLSYIWYKHQRLGEALGVWDEALFRPHFEDLEKWLQGIKLTGEASPRLRARILGKGEMLSSMLGTHYLTSQGIDIRWVDSRKFLKIDTNNHTRGESDLFLSAECTYDYDEDLRRKLNEFPEQMLMTQGFIAGNEDDETCLLGRGGSDTSASYYAARLGARRIENWTDVPGIFTANPRQVDNPRLIRRIGYEEALTLTSYGAGIIFPPSIIPARDKNIPIHVRQTSHPEREGTIIDAAYAGPESMLKAVTGRRSLKFFRMARPGSWQPVGFLSDVSSCFKQHGLSIDMLASSSSQICATLDPCCSPLSEDRHDKLMVDLGEFCEPEAMDTAASVSIVGCKVRSRLYELSDILKPLEGTSIHLLSQAADDHHLSFVVPPDESDGLVRKLHHALFETELPEQFFGPAWNDLKKEPQNDAKPVAAGSKQI